MANTGNPRREFSPAELEPLSRAGNVAQVSYLSQAKGFGLVATKSIAEGSLIIDREKPLAATLDPGQAMRCGNCFRQCNPEIAELQQCACGILYCCPTCMVDDGPSHALLCTGRVSSESHPLVEFKREAISINPMFLTAAKMVALSLSDPMVSTSRFNRLECLRWEDAVPPPVATVGDGDDVVDDEDEDSIVDGEESDEDRSRQGAAHQGPAEESSPEIFSKQLKDLAARMTELLEKAILLPSEPVAVKAACERFSNYLGCLERNQFVMDLHVEHDNGKEEEEGGEACASGIFLLCCQTNHDCDPNAELYFLHGTNEASIRALRDIAEGEEVTISYIEETNSLKERRAELRDYGFHCSCRQCSTEEAWIAIQRELSLRVSTARECMFPPRTIGGFDISFPENPTEKSVACLVVMEYPSMRVLYEACEDVVMTEPYISGFLAFREAPVCQRMLSVCTVRPDVLLLDGSGILHPRKCGLASHIGVVCDIATIGVSKKVLGVDGLTRDRVKRLVKNALSKGSRQVDLVGDSKMLWGRALVSPKAKNAVFVSVGHKIDLDGATEIIVRTCQKTRVPEPIRRADLSSREIIRKRQKGSSSASS